ncbi:MAG: hypothetical protein LBS64_01190, partial [Spirochaetaceae bacterium]|jgi:Tol biopolymer transport system component|nr:hypothetical protein [Spirochaetaceae bacterium]
VSVAPNGKTLFYCEAPETSLDKQLYLEDYRIMLLRDVNVSSKTPLVTDPSYGPAWYDDSVGFAYITFEQAANRVIKSNVTNGSKTFVTRMSAGEGDSNPSVRGGVILCDILNRNTRQVVSMKDNGQEITLLGEGEQPSWHPNGTKYLFVRRTEEKRGTATFYPAGIYEMDLKSGQATQIYSPIIDEVNKYAEVCSRPSYSKDGKYVLFAKGRDLSLALVERKNIFSRTAGKYLWTKPAVTAERRSHLFFMGADGSNLTQLTSGNVDVFSPAWGANNDIYFISNVQNATEIWKAHLTL